MIACSLSILNATHRIVEPLPLGGTGMESSGERAEANQQ